MAKFNTFFYNSGTLYGVSPTETVNISYNDYVQYLTGGLYKPLVKIEWLRNDETVEDEFTADVLSGNLTINRNNGIRRSVSLVLNNKDSIYIPNKDSYIWINKKFKLWLGFEINNVEYFLPQGVFVLSNPETVSNFSNKTVKISGVDKFGLLDGTLGGELNGIYQITNGTNINTAIKAILTAYGDDISPLLQTTTENTPYTIRKEYGETYGSLLIELAGILSRDIYYNENGHLVCEERDADDDLAVLWDFTTENSIYQGCSRIYYFDKVYNEVKVIGDNIDGDIATGVALNDKAISNTRYQLIGKRTKIIEDSKISTDTLAQARAEYELNKIIAVQSSISLNSLPMAHLDVGKAITIFDESLELNRERFIIESISIPLTLKSQMTIGVVKSSELL